MICDFMWHPIDQHLDVEVAVEDRLTVSSLVEVEHELGLVALVTRLSVQWLLHPRYRRHPRQSWHCTVFADSTDKTRTGLSHGNLLGKSIHNSSWTCWSNCQALETSSHSFCQHLLSMSRFKSFFSQQSNSCAWSRYWRILRLVLVLSPIMYFFGRTDYLSYCFHYYQKTSV